MLTMFNNDDDYSIFFHSLIKYSVEVGVVVGPVALVVLAAIVAFVDVPQVVVSVLGVILARK